MTQHSRRPDDPTHRSRIGRRTLLAMPAALVARGGRTAQAPAGTAWGGAGGAAPGAASGAASGAAIHGAGVGPSSASIHAMLSRQLDPGRESLGYVAGIIDANGTRVVAAGQSGVADKRALDGGSVFEIGSITKVFTALLLADMAQRGEVGLDDPVAKYLPPQARPQAFRGKPITLVDLATAKAGLPFMPANFHPANPRDPYAGYTLAQLDAFVSDYRLHYAPGEYYHYTNVGFALLGQALAVRAGRRSIAAVLLSNTRSWSTTPQLGRHLLNTGYQVPPIPRLARLDPAALAACAGRYRLLPHWVLTIRRDDDRLMVQGIEYGPRCRSARPLASGGGTADTPFRLPATEAGHERKQQTSAGRHQSRGDRGRRHRRRVGMVRPLVQLHPARQGRA